MKLSSVTAAPRILCVGGDPILISPPSLRDLAFLFSFLEDAIAPPDDADASWRPSSTDPASIELLSGPVGLPILLFVAMRRDNPEVRLSAAYELAGGVQAEDRQRLFDVVFRRDEPKAEVDISHWLPNRRGVGKPLEDMDAGKMFEEERLRPFSPSDIAGWSLDQIENKRSGGTIDDPVEMNTLDLLAWQARMREERRRRQQEEIRP